MGPKPPKYPPSPLENALYRTYIYKTGYPPGVIWALLGPPWAPLLQGA